MVNIDLTFPTIERVQIKCKSTGETQEHVAFHWSYLMNVLDDAHTISTSSPQRLLCHPSPRYSNAHLSLISGAIFFRFFSDQWFSSRVREEHDSQLIVTSLFSPWIVSNLLFLSVHLRLTFSVHSVVLFSSEKRGIRELMFTTSLVSADRIPLWLSFVFEPIRSSPHVFGGRQRVCFWLIVA